jgi:hypothetical protein
MKTKNDYKGTNVHPSQIILSEKRTHVTHTLTHVVLQKTFLPWCSTPRNSPTIVRDRKRRENNVHQRSYCVIPNAAVLIEGNSMHRATCCAVAQSAPILK